MKSFILEIIIKSGWDVVADIEEKFNSREQALKCLFNVEDELEEGEKISYKKIYELIHCDCGKPVKLTDFTNSCRCGSDYNMSGSKLAPREQWGEETGERWTECY